MKIVGKNIKKIRKGEKLTMRQLYAKSGVSITTLGSIESGVDVEEDDMLKVKYFAGTLESAPSVECLSCDGTGEIYLSSIDARICCDSCDNLPKWACSVTKKNTKYCNCSNCT